MGFNDFSIRGIDFNNDGKADMLDDILMDEMEEEELVMLEEEEAEERSSLRMRHLESLGDLLDDDDDEEDEEEDEEKERIREEISFAGYSVDELKWMDEDERLEALDDAGIDPDDFDYYFG